MIKTVMLLPVRDNDGHPFPHSAWEALEWHFMRAFGGFTRESNVAGAWEREGRVYRGVSRRYEVALPSWMHFPEWLDIVRWACLHFRQRALYVEVAGVPDIIEANPGHG